MAPRRSFFISAALALLVFAVALSCRFHYIHEFGFDSARGDYIWQVQGRGTIIAPPVSTDLDRLEFNLIEKGPREGYQSPAPLGPERPEAEIDLNRDPQKLKDEATAHRAPLYSYFRWAIWKLNHAYAWFDVTPVGVVRLAQIFLGSLTCMLYFVIALRAFGANRFLALLVGLATAAYPFWVMNAAESEDGTLAGFLLAWALALGIRIGQKGGVIRSYLFGLALAALALTRAAFLPFTIVAQLWFFIRCRQVPHGGLGAILMVLGYAMGLSPWLLRTYEMYGEPVPIATTTWFHLWIGNNPVADGSDFNWSMPKRLNADLLKKISATPQADRYELLAPLVLHEVEEHPVETLKRRVKASLQFFIGMNRLQGGRIFYPAQGPQQPEWLRPLLIGTLVVMYFFALFGWRWSYGWKSSSTPLTLALIWIPIPYILSHAGQLHASRLPLDGVILTMAVVGLFGMIPVLGSRLLAGEKEVEA